MTADTTVEHDGLVFDVRVTGPDDGEPVLLLHGFPQTSRSWAAVTERLDGAGLRLVAPDQRGYSPGARPAEVAAYAMEALAGDVLAVADALLGPRFHLVGHDWGASVAWHLAAHHPDRVLTLTALSVPHLAAFGWALAHDPEQQALSAYLKEFRRPGQVESDLLADDARRLREIYDGAVPPDDVEEYVALMRAGALTPALSWYRAMGRGLAATPPVRVPTTYVWGERDRATSAAAARRCGDHVDADYRFVALPGVTHWSPDEVPDDVAAAVLARVGEVTAADGQGPPGA